MLGSRRKRIKPLIEHPNAGANLVHAMQQGFWSPEEAAANTMGFRPEFLNPYSARIIHSKTVEAQEFLRRLDLIARAIKIGNLTEPLLPKSVIEWARKIELPLPSDLSATPAEVPAISSTADDIGRANEAKLLALQEENAELQRRLAEPNVRRLGSYQKIALIFAAKHHGYRPQDARNAAAGAIARESGKGALRVGHDTVRSCLREAAEDLGFDEANLEEFLSQDEIPSS